MLTLKQIKNNAYVFAQVMQINCSLKQAASSINNICDLNVTECDLKTLIKLRVQYFNIDKLFLQYEL